MGGGAGGVGNGSTTRTRMSGIAGKSAGIATSEGMSWPFGQNFGEKGRACDRQMVYDWVHCLRRHRPFYEEER